MAADADANRQGNMLGAYIRSQRQLADLSLRQLAQLTNVSNAYLSQIERGLHQPSLKVLRSIAVALELSADTLLAQAGLMDVDDPRATDADSARTTDAAAAKGHAGTEAAILADPHLTEDERQALLHVYRNFRRHRA